MLKDYAPKAAAFACLIALGIAVGYLLKTGKSPSASHSGTSIEAPLEASDAPSGAAAPTAAPAGPIVGLATQADKEAIAALKSAAEKGNARAQYVLALAYKNGRGVETNAVLALALMKKSADQNLAVAQRTLGIWFEQGEGVEKDLRAARQWYARAAGNGDVQAMHNLGYFYARGMGGLKRDGEAAEHWFKEAAERGLVASQINLAIIFSQSASYGMPPRMDQAYSWASVAAKRGDLEAARMRDALAGALAADVKSQIDQAVDKWKAKPIDVIANGGFDSSPEAFVQPGPQPSLTRAEMMSVQQRLNELGFNAGLPDGLPHAQTEAAIKAFQAAYGLPQTGIADRDLLAALNAIPH